MAPVPACSDVLQHSQYLLLRSAYKLWMVQACNDLIDCAGDKVTLLVRRGDSSQVGTNDHASLQLHVRRALLSVHSDAVKCGKQTPMRGSLLQQRVQQVQLQLEAQAGGTT